MVKNRKNIIIALGLALLILGGLVYNGCAGTSPTYENGIKTSYILPTRTDFDGCIILGRPENNSITASITTPEKNLLFMEWGNASGSYTGRSQEKECSPQNPTVIVMDGLFADQQYFYRVVYRAENSTEYRQSDEYTFNTPAALGSSYNFVVQSDSHLLNKADPQLYAESLQQMASLQPDFMFDLGDTFLNDQKVDAQSQSYDDVVRTVTQQLPYFDLVTRNVPLFLTIGNHEGEYGAYLDGSADNLAAKSTRARTTFFPNPVPDSFYSGNGQEEAAVGLPQDYYAFTWGDALYVSIDPYRYSEASPDNDTNSWDWTLGKTQYDWFRQTLENSDAKYKFVFAHHAIGNIRGGAEVARLYEWGGYDKNGQYLFDQKRPGWGKPIQQVMKENGVTIFFQGHDHLFAREDVDGVVYQTLPKPAEVVADQQSNFISYPSGDVLLNSGYLNITVSPANVRVDYNRPYIVSSAPQSANTGVVYSYTVDANHQVEVLKTTQDDLSAYGANPESQLSPDKGGKQRNDKAGKGTQKAVTADMTSPTIGIGANPAAAISAVPEGGFSFAIQADSHLDENTDVAIYKQTLSNIGSASPSFLIDLGDTSMVEKCCRTESEVTARYEAISRYLDLLGTLPIYPVTGNHDGENGWDASRGMLEWARAARQAYLPMPAICAYSGNTTSANYYSFRCGEAQFIILDPYTYSLQKARGDTDGWNYTLGKTQYDWLQTTLQNSTAKYKFVFIHNLVGGIGKDARGGTEAARFYEWGGYNADGTYGFDQFRPGWGEPIHQLLSQYGVTAVFHGHDHFYAHQELDGITYQLVPQPGGRSNTVQSATGYSYQSGTILPPAGYLRVSVGPSDVIAEYVVSSAATSDNGTVADKFSMN